MTHLHIDATIGIAGDMLLAALIDAGASLDVVRDAVAAVVADDVALRTERCQRKGVGSLRVVVEVSDDEQHHRSWAGIRSLLVGARLPPAVRDLAVAAFGALAEAEAAVHQVAPDEVHFHEVGALDSIADTVGVCAAVVDLAVASVSASKVGLGSGVVRTEHGILPVPAPATALLLRGAPTWTGPLPVEACTPTAAALLRALVQHWGAQPTMAVTAVGTGAGSYEDAEAANVTRVFVGDRLDVERPHGNRPHGDRPDADPPDGHRPDADRPHGNPPDGHRPHGNRPDAYRPDADRPDADPPDGHRPDADPPDGHRPDGNKPDAPDSAATGSAWLLSTNVDDLDPRLWPQVIAELLAAGASDAWLTPILMKKGRPAHTLSVLVDSAALPAVRLAVVRQTSSIGMRVQQVGKWALPRTMVQVEVLGHPVAVKVAYEPGVPAVPGVPGVPLNVQPEWEDVRRAAQQTGQPALTILQLAIAAAAEHWGT